MVEIKLEGLKTRQKVLADILWSIEEWADVERFIATLPKREKAECQSIVEMMKMELVETYREVPPALLFVADKVIAKMRLTK